MGSAEETLLAVIERAEEVLMTQRRLPARVLSLEQRLGFLDWLEPGHLKSRLDSKNQGDRSGAGQIAGALGLVRGMIDRLELETSALESRIKTLETLSS